MCLFVWCHAKDVWGLDMNWRLTNGTILGAPSCRSQASTDIYCEDHKYLPNTSDFPTSRTSTRTGTFTQQARNLSLEYSVWFIRVHGLSLLAYEYFGAEVRLFLHAFILRLQ